MSTYSRISFAALLLAAIAHSFSAMAADRFWISPDGGTFSIAANWTGGVVPGATDSANFNLADPGYTVTFTSGPVNTLLRLQNDNVTFDLNGFGYTLTSGAIIGQQNGDVSRLTLLDGVFSSGVDVSIASASASEAFLTVSTDAVASAASALRVGNSGTGTLSIINGGRATSAVGTLGQNATGEGNVNISGVESSWTTTGSLHVGNSGTGSLTVSAAGQLTNQDATLGTLAGSRGSVNLTGFSSSWRVTDFLKVGENGTGLLTVQSGASLFTGSAEVGRGTSGSGAITITGANSTWTNSGNLFAPVEGSGSITIADRATFTTANATISGSGSESGSLTVTGQGSQMRATGHISIGFFGVGEMVVTGGGQVRGALASVGGNTPAVGTLLVSDPGSSFAVTGTLQIGGHGRGTASVSGGGTISSGAAILGDQPGTVGTAVVSAAGSSWQSTGLSVANQGQGHFNISDGGFTSVTGDVSIGLLAGSNGSLIVTGAGSRLDANRFFVGGTSTTTTGGAALLAIGPGATASATTSARVIFGSRLTIDQGTFSTGTIDNRGLLVNTDGLILASSLANFGTLRLAGTSARVAASLGNSGLVTGTGEIAGSLFNAVGAEVRVLAADHLLFFASSNNNQGRINLLGGTLEFANSLTNTDFGTITGHGTLIFANSLSNGGKMQLSGGPTDIYGNVTFSGGAGGGEVINSGSSNVVTFYGNVQHAGDEIRTSPTNTTVFFGSFSGAGPFTGTGAVRFEGSVTPGASPAAVPVEGDVQIGADSRLVMELAGTTAGAQYDQLHVGGLLSLDGALDVTLLDGFNPRYGDTFDLLDFGALTGRFDTIELPVLGGGLAWDTSALYSAGTITAVPEPAAWLLAAIAGGILMHARRRRT